MSCRYWLYNFAIGGILVAAVLVLLFWSGQTDNRYQQSGASPPQQAQQNATADPALAMVGAEGTVETDWNSPKCGQPKSHDEADLCEQRRMAKAAEDSVLLSKIQIILGVTGAALLFWTLYYSRRATVATAHAAEAAHPANKLSREMFVADQRPWVFVMTPCQQVS